jgi:type II secretory pathway predicted ATPase ExeA
MYEQVFNFNARPFTAAPYVKHYFAGEAIQNALEQTRLNVDRGAGPVIIVGATGTGKTLLLAILEAGYCEQVKVVNLACARLQERKDLLQSILHRLNLPFQGMSETELRFSLMDYLEPNPNCVNGIVLLVDDAHGLSASLLDELGLITNFVSEGQPRVRLVLAGSHRLEENLNEAKLESLNQRIAARCYLENMSRSEASRYVVEHIARVGGDGEKLFPEEACRAIHEVTDGYPRLINQVADHALMLAATRGMSAITDDCIREAWADVQSIPATFQPELPAKNEPGELSGDDNWSVLEFGQLEDAESEDSGMAIFANETDSAAIQFSSMESSETVVERNGVDSFSEDVEPSEGDLLPMENDFMGTADDARVTQLELEHAQILEQVERERMELYEAQESVTASSTKRGNANASQGLTSKNDLEAMEIEVTSPPPAGVNQSQEVVDPFQEKFAEEEVLDDYFAPMVAQQNQASLSIRSVDLTDLTPQDLPEVNSEVPATSQDSLLDPEDDSVVETEQGVEVYQREPAETKYYQPNRDKSSVSHQEQQSMGEQSGLPEVPSGYEFTMGTDWTSTNANRSAEESAPEAEVNPEPNEVSEKGFHVHGDDVVSKDIRKQAEEILGRLSASESPLGDQGASNSLRSIESSALPSESASSSDCESDSSYPSAALDESQQILNEILEQRNALAQQGELAASMPVLEEQGAGDQFQATDIDDGNEKPIIVVKQTEDAAEEKPPVVDPPIPPTTPPSTGRAARMDYQKLFEQLRDISNSQNS